MSNLRFVEKLANATWLCEPEHVEFMYAIFLRYLDRAATSERLDREAIEQSLGRPLENTRAVTIRDGVAKIPVEGTIVRRASLFTEMSGGVSTETLTKDFVTAYNDATVHSILFVFDTPGGEVSGVNELAGLIREKRDEGQKRIEAYCDGLCASAGYWLASATSKVTTDATGTLGAIGVVSRVRNPDAINSRETLEFWNARSPKKRLDYKSYEGQAAIQEYVDTLGDEFISVVADNRGVSVEKVERDFGQGFVLAGRKAVEVGMADALGSEEGVIASLGEAARERSPARMVAAATTAGGGPAAFTDTTNKEEQVTEQTTEHRPNEAGGEEAVEWAAAEPVSAETLLDRVKGLLGMTPTAIATATEPGSSAAPDDRTTEETDEELAGTEGEETDSGMSEGAPQATQTEEEREESMTDNGAGTAIEGAASREELEQLRADLEAERTKNARTAAVLRERGIDRMLDAKGTFDLGNGKRGVMPPAQRNAAKALISALAAAGEDPIELSASGEATLADNEAGKALGNLLTNWDPQELGERGLAGGEGPSEDGETAEGEIRALMERENISYREAAVRLSGRNGEVE